MPQGPKRPKGPTGPRGPSISYKILMIRILVIRTIRVEFIGTSFSLGPLKIGMNDNGKDATGSKYYDFIHVDTDIAIARSSSGGYTILSPYNRKK